MTGPVLLVEHRAPRTEWLTARRAGIGASEIAAVLGISPYDSPFSLWWRKHMGWSAEVNDEMRIGTFLESAIADWFAENRDPNEQIVFDYAGLYGHPERPWQVATPDRLMYPMCTICHGQGVRPGGCYACSGRGYEPDLAGVLECKWVAASWDGWGDEDTDQIPVHYRAQALWQMDVMDVGEVSVCALGPGGFRTFRVRRDEKDLVLMREAGRRFMASLAAGEPPDVDDHAATMPILRRLHASIEDRKQEIPAPVAVGFLRAKAYLAKAKRVEARYVNQMRAHMGTAKTAVCAGRTIAARTASDQLRSKG